MKLQSTELQLFIVVRTFFDKISMYRRRFKYLRYIIHTFMCM